MTIVRWIAAFVAFFVIAFVGMLWLLEYNTARPGGAGGRSMTTTESIKTNSTAVDTGVLREQTRSNQTPSTPQPDAVPESPADDAALTQQTPESPSISSVEPDIDAVEAPVADPVAPVEAPAVTQPERAVDPEDAQPRTTAEGDETLRGRVLNSEGDAMTGVTVTIGYRDPVTRRVSPRKRSARVNDKGVYLFEDIAPGEYQLSHLPVAGYANRTAYVRAGSGSADLVLTAIRSIVIKGKVTTEDNLPISGATAVVSGSKTVTTGADGGYVTEATIQANSAVAVRVSAEGFAEETRLVNGREVLDETEAVVDVVLKPLGNISVSGSLRTESGEPVANELVRIFSPGLRLSARSQTDVDGRFDLKNLQSGDDFRISVIPRDRYERLEQGPIAVVAGMAPLELTLRVHAQGQVTGSIQTTVGEPLPGFSMSLTSSSSPASALVVRADETGRFVVNDVPAGQLHFSTPSQPHIDVRGVELAAGDQVDLRIVIDLGPYALSGTVADSQGQPVAGANVVMTWRQSSGGLSSSSYRQTSTDASGRYQFTELSAGEHSLAINHLNFGQAQQAVNIGPALERLDIQLPDLQ